MTTRDFLLQIQNSAVAHAVSKSDHLVGASLQIVHVLGFVLLLASLLLIDLRLLGLALREQSLPKVSAEATRLLWLGFALVLFSGTLMFAASPLLYFYKLVFKLKLVLLLFAVAFQAALFRRVAARELPSVALARTSVALSLLLWFGVGMAGRMIGFV